MRFAKKIKFLKNMYSDDEDFRDTLEHEGIISEDDMPTPYIQVGHVGEIIKETLTKEDCTYYVDNCIEVVLTKNRYKQWLKDKIFEEVK